MTAPPVTYSYLVMDMEQFAHLDHEVFLLKSVGKHAGQSQQSLTAAYVAAAIRLVGEGLFAQAKELLHVAAESGYWSPAAQLTLEASGHRGHLQLASTPRACLQLAKTSRYWKELSLLQHVLDNACPGDATSVCNAMDHFAECRWEELHQWSKVAGDVKSDVLCGTLRGAAHGVNILEIGTYCGYTALRMVAAFPSASITTIEVDPMHVIIARNMIALSGSAQCLEVWTGHSKYLLPRLAKHQVDGLRRQYGALYMDRWGSEYHDDFIVLDGLGLLECSAVVIADQVLWTGASLFLWDVASKVNCSTRLVPVSVRDDAIAEDFLAVGACSGNTRGLQPDAVMPPPPCFRGLHAEASLFREKWFGSFDSRGTVRDDFARDMQARMLAELANLGYQHSDGILPVPP
eukprot:TRINITY_DN13422_c0_g1_i4.p1 TRINITY_DN13422_c0_g1~~TRINITY_DN13422_c0_g1_i4.p1  ORF type:complete len:404 (-),score=56.47 TRINITY_DN13422_c0_g1_i4:326-1537(-)